MSLGTSTDAQGFRVQGLGPRPPITTNWSHLSSLEILDVSNNRLRQVDHISFPLSLTSLLVTNNDISDVPTEWALLERLQTLSLSGDPPGLTLYMYPHYLAPASLPMSLSGDPPASKNILYTLPVIHQI